MKHCGSCGGEALDENTQCRVCGAPLPKFDVSPLQKQVKPMSGGKMLFYLFLLGLAAYWWSQHGPSVPEDEGVQEASTVKLGVGPKELKRDFSGTYK
ncbi:MAG: hypothetical protein HY077_18730 [Elusimicrobia bacterium]|nr:hypothetical protein [Elusimicrobiota bacterium]